MGMSNFHTIIYVFTISLLKWVESGEKIAESQIGANVGEKERKQAQASRVNFGLRVTDVLRVGRRRPRPGARPSLCFVCAARSISEEFSSGDTRCRDNDEQQSAHSRDPRKDKEDKERGDDGTYPGLTFMHKTIIEYSSEPMSLKLAEKIFTKLLESCVSPQKRERGKWEKVKAVIYISQALIAVIPSCRNDKSIRRKQFTEAADIPGDHGVPTGRHRPDPDAGSASIPHHQRPK